MNTLAFELDLIAARLDAWKRIGPNQRGAKCNESRGWYGVRGGCVRGKKGASGDDLKAKRKESAEKLAGKIRAKKGMKSKDEVTANKVTPDWDKKLGALEDIGSASFKDRVAGVEDRLKRTGSESFSRYLNKEDIDKLADYAPKVDRTQVRVGDHLIIDKHVSDPRVHLKVVSQKGNATYGVPLNEAGQETSSKKVPIKFNGPSVTYQPKLVLDPESYFKKRAEKAGVKPTMAKSTPKDRSTAPLKARDRPTSVGGVSIDSINVDSIEVKRTMNNLDLELSLIAAKLDAKGQGVACGKGWISPRSKCSKDKASNTTKENLAKTTANRKKMHALKAEVAADKGKKAKDVAGEKAGAKQPTAKQGVQSLLDSTPKLPPPSVTFKTGDRGKEAGDYSYLGTVGGKMRFVGKNNAYTTATQKELAEMVEDGIASVDSSRLKDPKLSHDMTLENVPKGFVAPKDQGRYMHTGTKGSQMQFIGLDHNNSILLDKGDVADWHESGWLTTGGDTKKVGSVAKTRATNRRNA